MRFWQDHVADTLDAIAFGLISAGKRNVGAEMKPYSEYAHPTRKKRQTPRQTYEQIVQSVLDKM